MTQLLSGYLPGRVPVAPPPPPPAPSTPLHAAVGVGQVTLEQALDTFRQDYAPVLRIVIPRRRSRRPVQPTSPFLKQR
jgi:hypothetical protein